MHMLVTRTHTTWDDALVKEKTFSKLGQVVPAVLIYKGISLVPLVPDLMDKVVQNVAAAWTITAIAMAITTAIAAAAAMASATAVCTAAAEAIPTAGF